RDRRRLGHRQHQHLARLQALHRGVHHEVVVLPAADRAGLAADPGAGDDLAQVGVDEALAPGRLVHGRGAQPRELAGDVLGHSWSTTWGITRWNDSPKRTSWLPDARRAWLPRCSPRWV